MTLNESLGAVVKGGLVRHVLTNTVHPEEFPFCDECRQWQGVDNLRQMMLSPTDVRAIAEAIEATGDVSLLNRFLASQYQSGGPIVAHIVAQSSENAAATHE